MKTQTARAENTATDDIVCIGIDWADRKHAFHLIDGEGNESADELEQTPEAIVDWVANLRQQYPLATFHVCIEQSKGALISALLMHDCIRIFPINPTQLANYRKAMTHGGSKNDPGDARLLAQFLLHYGDQLRLLEPGDTDTPKLTILVEDRRRIVDQRTAVALELKATLKQYFPLVLQLAQSKVYAQFICRLLLKWPTLEKLQGAKPTTLQKFFYGQNLRGDHVQRKLELIAQAKPLTQDAAILETYARRVQRLARLLLVDADVIAGYDNEIEKLLKAHADFKMVASLERPSCPKRRLGPLNGSEAQEQLPKEDHDEILRSTTRILLRRRSAHKEDVSVRPRSRGEQAAAPQHASQTGRLSTGG